jgi:hypothetical protein
MRPWRKKPWPYVRADGSKSWRLGYRDHEGVTRAKAFPTAGAAKSWKDRYVEAERLGNESLRRFLLDLDAAERSGVKPGKRLGEVVQLYLAFNAPDQEGGLAPATHKGYLLSSRRHLLGQPGENRRHEPVPPWPHAIRVAQAPAVDFNGPEAPRAWRDEMLRAGAPDLTGSWKALSSCLSWSASSDLVPEIVTNGCKLANENRTNRRRSARRGGAGIASSDRRTPRQGQVAESWALSAFAVEHIRAMMLRRVTQRRFILPWRDATIVSIQYGLGNRNQEVFALRWRCLGRELMDILEALTMGSKLDEGKTWNSTPRQTTVPSLLFDDLAHWRLMLQEAGHSTRPEDFIIPGDLAAPRWGVHDPRDGACHCSFNQAQKWGPKYFSPAVAKVAAEVEALADIKGATEYALRRGNITARTRSEDPQIVVAEAGTSLAMLDEHYSFALREYRRAAKQPLDIVWREARAAVSGEPRPRLQLVG